MPLYPPSQLDADQVIQHAFDETTQTLRTTATATVITPPAIEVTISAASGDNIAISDGVDTLSVNADGSINVVITGTVDVSISHTNDSIRLGDGTSLVGTTTDSGNIGLNVSVIEKGQDTSANSIPVVLASDQSTLNVAITSSDIDIRDLNAAQDDVLVAGTEDGTSTGTLRWFVNNRRQQILSAHDRATDYTFADAGTKNERITQIDYTSPTFPGITIQRQFTYTLNSGKYTVDTDTWSVI